MNKLISVGLTSLLIAVGFAASGHSQTYFVSTPMSGDVDMDVYYELNGFPKQVVGNSVGFGTLNDTLYYDPASNTIRQVGNVTMDSSGFTAQFAVYQDILTSPTLTTLTGQVSITESVGTISFDTGVEPINSNFGFELPVTGSYTFDTGGAEYTGTFSYNLDVGYGSINVSSVTSTTLTFSGSGVQGGSAGPFLGSVMASNGFYLAMAVGSDDTTYDANWSIPSVMAEAIPEPSTFLLLLLAASSLLFLRARRR